MHLALEAHFYLICLCKSVSASLHRLWFAWHLRIAIMLLAMLTCDYAGHFTLPCQRLSGENSPDLTNGDAAAPRFAVLLPKTFCDNAIA
jgi:hypothetical protein